MIRSRPGAGSMTPGAALDLPEPGARRGRPPCRSERTAQRSCPRRVVLGMPTCGRRQAMVAAGRWLARVMLGEELRAGAEPLSEDGLLDQVAVRGDVDVCRRCQLLKAPERLRDPRRIRATRAAVVPRDRHATLEALRPTATNLWARVNAVRNFYCGGALGQPVVFVHGGFPTLASLRSVTGSRRQFRRLAAAGRRARRPGSWHASTRPATLRIVPGGTPPARDMILRFIRSGGARPLTPDRPSNRASGGRLADGAHPWFRAARWRTVRPPVR